MTSLGSLRKVPVSGRSICYYKAKAGTVVGVVVEPKMVVNGRAAALVRVSTDKQETDSQRQVIQRWAEANGVGISRWYEEVGRSRHKAMWSPTFEGMIADGESRAYDWLIVESRTRFGTKDTEEYGYYSTRLKRAGVGIYSVAQGDLTTPTDVAEITNAVEGLTSKSELREKARRTARGMYANGLAGYWNGGAVPPLGYDLSCVDPAGREQFRVVIVGKHHRIVVNQAGDRLELVGKGRNPGKAAKTDRYRLVVSEVAERIETVRLIFHTYIHEKISLTAIAKRLNSEGRYLYGKPWANASVRNVLENPIYVGRKCFNRRTNAAYQRVSADGQGYVEAKWQNNKPKYEKLPRSEWVAPTATDEAAKIIDDATFEAAQTKLAGIISPVRAPRSAALWLAPFLTCGSCSGKMRGWAPSQHPEYRSYFCATFDEAQKTWGKGKPGRPGFVAPCRKNRVPAEQVEAALGEFLRRYGEGCRLEAEAAAAWVEGRPNPRVESLRADQARSLGSLGVVFSEMRAFIDRIPEADLPDPSTPGFIPGLINLYRQYHEVEQSSVRTELLAAEDHLARLVGSAAYLESGGPAHRALLRQIAEAEAKVRALEPRLVPAHQRLDSAIDRIHRVEEEIAEVQRALAGSANRVKAEALGRVVRRIVLHTKPNPKQGGWHPSDLLDSVTFEPIIGDPIIITTP